MPTQTKPIKKMKREYELEEAMEKAEEEAFLYGN